MSVYSRYLDPDGIISGDLCRVPHLVRHHVDVGLLGAGVAVALPEHLISGRCESGFSLDKVVSGIFSTGSVSRCKADIVTV